MKMTQKLEWYIKSKFNVDDHVLQQIVSQFRYKTTFKNEILLSKGDTSKYCYFVEQGVLRMFYLDKKGEEQTGYFATENTFGGGLSSFISQEPSIEFVQSFGIAHLLVIDRATFYSLIHENQTFALIYQDILEMSYSHSVKRIGTLMTMEAKERINWVFNNQLFLFQKVPNKMIASYLGIKPQTFSRLLKHT